MQDTYLRQVPVFMRQSYLYYTTVPVDHWAEIQTHILVTTLLSAADDIGDQSYPPQYQGEIFITWFVILAIYSGRQRV